MHLQILINISFNLIGHTTLGNVGAKSVTTTGTGASARCTVLLRVTILGEIFNGMPIGRVAHDTVAPT